MQAIHGSVFKELSVLPEDTDLLTVLKTVGNNLDFEQALEVLRIHLENCSHEYYIRLLENPEALFQSLTAEWPENERSLLQSLTDEEYDRLPQWSSEAIILSILEFGIDLASRTEGLPGLANGLFDFIFGLCTFPQYPLRARENLFKGRLSRAIKLFGLQKGREPEVRTKRGKKIHLLLSDIFRDVLKKESVNQRPVHMNEMAALVVIDLGYVIIQPIDSRNMLSLIMVYFGIKEPKQKLD